MIPKTKPKLGRPTLPEGESKDFQTGVRFKAKENELVEKAAAKADQDKAKWLRQVALEATQEWITCDEYSIEELHDKTVHFQLVTILEGPVRGGGKFDVWGRGDGKIKIRIITTDPKSTVYERHELLIYVPQKGVGLIKRAPKDSGWDFVLYDPAFQKYAGGRS